jgi:hypothetical protein
MGTGTNSTNTQKRVSNKPPRCSLCNQTYTPTCDFMQGRCPHHPSIIDLGKAGRVVKTRFSNLIKFFTGKK